MPKLSLQQVAKAAFVEGRKSDNMVAVSVDTDHSSHVFYNPNLKVDVIRSPLSDYHTSAEHRTIRIKRQLSANHFNTNEFLENKCLPVSATGAIAEAMIHSMMWKEEDMPEQANRDRLAVAYRDARELINEVEWQHAKNQAINAGNHSAKEAYDCSYDIRIRTAASCLAAIDGQDDHKLESIIASKIGYKNTEVIKAAIRLAKKDRIKAVKHISSIMKNVFAHQKSEVCSRTVPRMMEGPDVPDPMKITILPMTPNKKAMLIPRSVVASSGQRLNRPALSRMIANKSTASAFRRTKCLLGGSYLFDASGSMNVSRDILGRICNLAPAATIAYYGGYDGENVMQSGQYGELYIYAQNGMRARKVVVKHKNNAVDLYALRWLLKQPAPRYFVTDMQFGGGPQFQGELAYELLVNSMEMGNVTHYASYYELPFFKQQTE